MRSFTFVLILQLGGGGRGGFIAWELGLIDTTPEEERTMLSKDCDVPLLRCFRIGQFGLLSETDLQCSTTASTEIQRQKYV